jgi:hypothetical protein
MDLPMRLKLVERNENPFVDMEIRQQLSRRSAEERAGMGVDTSHATSLTD